MLDEVSSRPVKIQTDLDMDGQDEIFLQNGAMQAVLRLDGSASICEFDSYRLQHNFGDTLARQAEHYHRKIHVGADHEHSGEGIANPHERISFKHEIVPEDLTVDSYAKTLFRDFLVMDGMAEQLTYQPATSSKTALAFHSMQRGVRKHIELEGESLLVRYSFSEALQGAFKVEINLAMPSCDGPAGRFRMAEEILGGFGQAQARDDVGQITLEDEVLGGALQLHVSHPCQFTSLPHFSVSQSEAGFEKIMQAVSLVLAWPAEFSKELKVKITII
jgi:hypothetical protein